jgi:hypothetical protein
MPGSLCDRETGHFVEHVAARTVPLDDPGVNVDGLGERLVAFCVVGVDGLPRRQHEHDVMERVGREHGFQFDRGHRRRVVKHAKRLDQAAIEEDPLRRVRPSDVLLDVSAQDLSSEGNRIGPATRTARNAFRDDGPGGFLDGWVAHRGQFSQERGLARARPAGDDDVSHEGCWGRSLPGRRQSVKTVSVRD